MIPFLDLKAINQQHRQALIDAVTRVIDSGWYVLGQEVKTFEQEFASYCGTQHCVGMANGLDALVLTLRAWKELGKLKEGDEVIVFGRQISLSEFAQKCETIPYEILTSISQRVKRIYLEE